MTDTAQQVRAILSRTLRELNEAIANPRVSSMLAGLGSLLGLDQRDTPAASAAQAPRKRGSGAPPQRVCSCTRPRGAPARRNTDAQPAQRLLERCFGRLSRAKVAGAEHGVIRSGTSFGGGKTHGLMAVYHLATGARPSNLAEFVDATLLPVDWARTQRYRRRDIARKAQLTGLDEEHAVLVVGEHSSIV